MTLETWLRGVNLLGLGVLDRLSYSLSLSKLHKFREHSCILDGIGGMRRVDETNCSENRYVRKSSGHEPHRLAESERVADRHC